VKRGPVQRGPTKRCGLAVIDAQRRAKGCGAPAVTERTIYDVVFDVCAECAAHHDAALARGEESKARELVPLSPEDAALRVKWEQEQQKLPPGKRRTWEQALDDDEQRMGQKLRRGRKRGEL
jgi:hypothetical protein